MPDHTTRPALAILLAMLAGGGTTLAGDTAPDAVAFGPLDYDRLVAEDLVNDRVGVPLRFAVAQATSLRPGEVGDVDAPAPNLRRWRLRIESADAKSINLGTIFALPASASVQLLDAKGTAPFRAFTADDNHASGELWTPIVPGRATEVLAIVNADEWDAFAAGFEITSVNLGYRGFETAGEISTTAPSAACHVDVACPQADDWQPQVASVGLYSINGTLRCSGVMLNNTAEDGTPYFYTAEHCNVSAGNAASMVVYWNYQNSTCREPGSPESGGPGDGTLDQFTTGATWRMEWVPADATLVELSAQPLAEYGVVYAGWNRSSGTPGPGVGIHHPLREEKRINLETTGTSTATVDGKPVFIAQFEEGGTEAGSSGSPYFDADGRVVGAAYAVDITEACFPQSTFYGRISVGWVGGGTPSTSMREWLDPLGEDPLFLNFLGQAPMPPGDFDIISPEPGATNVPTNPQLRWSASENATTYVVTLDDDPDFSSPELDFTTSQTQLSLPPGFLDEATLYAWSVVASNIDGETQATPSPASFATVGYCPTDFDGSGTTDLADLNIVLQFFNSPQPAGTNGDANGSGFVDLDDLNEVLFRFGTEC